ncbi:MAG: hypothetical protein DMG39_31330, partial [Acidobacteria bacterium]
RPESLSPYRVLSVIPSSKIVYLALLLILTMVNMGVLEIRDILLMIFAKSVLAGLVLSLLPVGAFAQGETTSAIASPGKVME